MWDLSIFSEVETWIALSTLIAIEVVLGIDNIIFISILTEKLPEGEKAKGRNIGLAVALLSRLALLFAISWVMQLTEPLFQVFNRPMSGRDIILLVGGLFLVAKATHEIFETVETHEDHAPTGRTPSLRSVILQIVVLDIVFSLDSVITAVGMADHILVMAIAIVVAVGIMLITAKSISEFVARHPSIRVLALSFLILIGVMLIAESFGQHVAKGYLYFAMAFSLTVELVNIRVRKPRLAVPRPESPHAAESISKLAEER